MEIDGSNIKLGKYVPVVYLSRSFITVNFSLLGYRWTRKISNTNSELLSVNSTWKNQLLAKVFNHFFFSDAQGAILVYDVTKHGTFQKLESWLNELEIYGTKSNMIKIVVGNKIDQSIREVSRDEGIRFAKKHRTLFLETSAKTSEGVKETFEEVVRKILETTNLWDDHSVPDSARFILSNHDHEGHSYCSGLSCSLT